jgi:hypothetical protein
VSTTTTTPDWRSLLAGRPGELVGEIARGHWHDERTGVAVPLDPAEVATLNAWQVIDTLAGFEARVAREPSIDAARAPAIVAGLRARGLIAPLGTLLPETASRPVAEPPLLAVKTCRRPQALERLLDSIAIDARRHGVEREILVVDDSADPDAEALTRAAVERHAGRGGARIRVFASSEREPLLQALERDLAPEQRGVLRAMLCPRSNPALSSARATNWITLLGAGRIVAPLDDDFHLPVRAPRDAGWRIDVRNRVVTTQRFAADPAQFEDLAAVESDPFATGASLLGQTPAALLDRYGVELTHALGTASAEWRHLSRPDSRVIATVQGRYGSLNVDHCVFLNCFDPDTLDELWRPPYTAARLDGRAVASYVPSLRLLSQQYVQPQLVDDRELLPYSGTFGRADDTLWLAMIGAVVGGALFATLPQMLGHHQIDEHNQLVQTLQGPPIAPNEFVAHWLDEIASALASTDRERRLAVVGAYAADLAGAGDADVADRVRRWHHVRLAERLRHLERAIRHGEGRAPDHWRRLATQLVQTTHRQLLDESGILAAVPDVRRVLSRIGVASSFWPRLWRRTRSDAASRD